MAIGSPVVMKVGGAVSTGPQAGIYHVQVTEATLGTSKQKGTPYIELTFSVKDDPDHASREGKKLMNQRFYGPGEHHDEATALTMQGMLKRGIFRGFNVPWPKEGVNLDARKFVGKTAWVLVAQEKKPQDPNEPRMEVQRIAQEKSALESAKKADEETPQANTEAKKPASRR